eukprot:TRINITY_DN56273_c0_g1_i1.p1 TRINITY_DN56273_c0_g1~~TRINITY_DN56273_c0_g1_i1.p1  ORF type:complete len:211 (+),score=64.15 TRINITY_DN56273_c0_g1_i1:84-635(+)
MGSVFSSAKETSIHAAAYAGDCAAIDSILDHDPAEVSRCWYLDPTHSDHCGGDKEGRLQGIARGPDGRFILKEADLAGAVSLGGEQAGSTEAPPLHFAVLGARPAAVQLLLRRGADPGRKADCGALAEDIAEANGCSECAAVLRQELRREGTGLSRAESSFYYADGLTGMPRRETRPVPSSSN